MTVHSASESAPLSIPPSERAPIYDPRVSVGAPTLSGLLAGEQDHVAGALMCQDDLARPPPEIAPDLPPGIG
jgi:hypothetical protein